MSIIKSIIFDLGGVLIDWNPRYVYRTIFDSEEKMDWFFEKVCTSDWNEMQDEGRSLAVATAELIEKHPEYEKEIRAFYGRWEEMLGGPIQETVDIFQALKQSKLYNFYALTNWSAETFPVALARYDFLKWFDGIVMSGAEKSRKPFPAFYQILLDRYHIKPGEAIFIDDNLRNVKAAQELGIPSIHFQSATLLKHQLNHLGVKWENAAS